MGLLLAACSSADKAADTIADVAIADITVDGVNAVEEVMDSNAVADLISSGESVDASQINDALSLANIFEIAEVTSYQFDMNMSLSDGNEATQSINTAILYSADPAAMSMTFSGAGIDVYDEMGEVSMIQIGESLYMSVPELGCMALPSSDAELMSNNPMGNIFEASSINELERVTKIGTETINGVETTHYIFDESSFADGADKMETAVGHIYVATNGGYLVRMVLSGSGDITALTGDGTEATGSVHLEMDLTHINEPITIDTPADCEDVSGLADEAAAQATAEAVGPEVDGVERPYPTAPDAFDLHSMAGTANYKSEMPPEEVLAFYEYVTPDMGWIVQPEKGISTPDSTTIIYEKNGESLSVTIGADPNGESATFVLIFMQEIVRE
jgi:hypothetical protein